MGAKTVFVVVVLAFALVGAGARSGGAADGFEPTRQDLGDLIVLDVAGSYEEMGRQQAELLGDDLRRVYEQQRLEHERAVARGGFGDALLDTIGIPLWSGAGGAFEDSHFHEELAGMPAGVGVARRDRMRALLALGARRPLVVRYRPDNGDLEHLFAGWPLVGLPTVGVNEAGFALSFNDFETDPQVGMLLPQWPHRRALQTARSVEEGIQIFLDARGISAFMVMADAAGDLAMVECSPSRCAVFRPDGDWFGQANHARTEGMIPFDRYRSPDSFDRRAGIEAAVARHLPALTPDAPADVLRDRSLHPWPSASNVANLSVLHAAVVHPASRTRRGASAPELLGRLAIRRPRGGDHLERRGSDRPPLGSRRVVSWGRQRRPRPGHSHKRPANWPK